MKQEIKDKLEKQCHVICENATGGWFDIAIEAAEFGYNLAIESPKVNGQITAVDTIINSIDDELRRFKINEDNHVPILMRTFNDVLKELKNVAEEAKKMETRQIVTAWNFGVLLIPLNEEESKPDENDFFGM